MLQSRWMTSLFDLSIENELYIFGWVWRMGSDEPDPATPWAQRTLHASSLLPRYPRANSPRLNACCPPYFAKTSRLALRECCEPWFVIFPRVR